MIDEMLVVMQGILKQIAEKTMEFALVMSILFLTRCVHHLGVVELVPAQH